ncbi:aminotransferase class III-fold pyridoxal phosphate-dependent enzyme [Rhodovulum sp. DZ06]|uniref:aminotransferase class III-fold pyridoxal phosphate-dependent enzyme n=1 Tax=Rhodovulum sp. DZ06 TaxID=3425126 RepID=UPI003D32C14C
MFALNPARAQLLETFALDVRMVRAEGAKLFDENGVEHLDFLAQYGALPFGHNPSHIWDRLGDARDAQLPSLVQPLRPVEAERLAERLVALAPGDISYCTLANSGAEAVEAAIKLARVRTGRDGILSTSNSFHGKTLGALSATGKPMYQVDFAAPAPGFDTVPFGDAAALDAALTARAGEIAAFIVEPVQGEGGVIVPPEGYIAEVIEICRRHGVLSVIDEIQTGLGRTGKLFACEDAPEAPDMLLLAKALGGGMVPIAACLSRPAAWDDRFGLLHSSTFANNNLACVVANATLDLLLEDDRALIRAAAENGAYLRGRLEALAAAHPSVIKDVRGKGLMTGLEFHRFDMQDDSALMAFASLNGGLSALVSSWILNERGVLTAPLFNDSHVMRLQPPLVITRAQIDKAVDAIADAVEMLDRKDYVGLARPLVRAGRVAALAEAEASRAAAAPQDAGLPAAPSRAAAAAPVPGRFAFLIHYTEEADILRSDPSFANLSDEELSDWIEWVKRLGPGQARPIPQVVSKTGAVAEGMIMSVPMLARDMRGKGKRMAAEMVHGAVEMAAAGGASRMGLGAFTSIVTRGGQTATGRGVPISSGNTLTTVAAVKAIERAAAEAGLDLERANIVVVGATGAIGRLGAMMLGRRAGRLTLVGNAANAFAPRLLSRAADDVVAALADPELTAKVELGALARHVGALAGRIGARDPEARKDLHKRFLDACAAHDGPAPLTWTTDIDAALAEADVALVATSSDVTLVDPSALRPGALVCDVARPPNVAKAELLGSGVLVFDGGLVVPPSEIELGPFQTLPKSLCWGCLGETMLLALSGQERDFSIGAELSLADADLVAELADEHGFEPAPMQWYGEEVGEVQRASFREAVRARAASRFPAAAWRLAAE